MELGIPTTLEQWNENGRNYLPGHLGMTMLKVELDEVIGILEAKRQNRAWNGFLHAGTVVSFADTCCGYGAVCNLPKGSVGFTTTELKSNFVSTVKEGEIKCIARPVHIGRSTQVWDATVFSEETGKNLALFRCTQIILWPK
jgi:uncharacterized protein (TIGR00369 family)